MRSKIRSKVYKRTKKKRLSKKNKRQKGGSTSDESMVDGQTWWQHECLLLRKGIKVLLKIGNKYKKCRILKIESNSSHYFLNFYVDKGGREEKRVEECKKIVSSDADSAMIVDGNSVKISDHIITPVSSCNRAVKSVWRLGQMRLEDDTGEGFPKGAAEYLLKNIQNAVKFKANLGTSTTVLQRGDFGVSQSDLAARDAGSYQ